MKVSVNKKLILLMGCLMMTGAILRLIACFWGYPNQYHPDEGVIVDSALDMIERNSWEASRYNRPDHFEIKGVAILLEAYSRIAYHCKASEVTGDKSYNTFYLIARGYTTFWGVLMIPLAYLIAERLKKNSGAIVAGLTALYPVFVTHSAYATPDIVLLFFIMLLWYISMLYIEMPTTGKVVAMSVAVAVSITIKYTGAFGCVYIAIIVIYNCIKEKKYLDILKLGCIAVLVVLATMFFIAPNLFTNWEAVRDALLYETGGSPAGHSGLSPIGNFWYYVTLFFGGIGVESVVFFALGLAYIISSKSKMYLSFIQGVIMVVFTCVLELHWERWGIPIYIYLLMITGVGISYAIDICRQTAVKNILGRVLRPVTYTVGILMIINFTVSDVAYLVDVNTRDTRKDQVEFCQQNNITEEETVYDGYCAFLQERPHNFEIKTDNSGKLVLDENKKDAKYVFIASNVKEAYESEPEMLADRIRTYKAIEEQLELVERFDVTRPEQRDFMIANIAQKIKYLVKHNDSTRSGNTLYIYKL